MHMYSFDSFWQMLYNHGASLYHRHDCFALWGTLAPARQQQLYDAISVKLREGRFVDYNPLRAMHDNLRQSRQPTPTNYNGKALPRGMTFYHAEYNGQRGLYSEQDVTAHKMQNAELFIINN